MLVSISVGVVGLVFILLAPVFARVVMRGRDPVALTRMIQAVGAVLVIVSLLFRPYNPDTTAVPPPPDVPDARGR